MSSPDRVPEPAETAEPVHVEVMGSILVITLDRPEVRNAVNCEVAERVEAAIDLLESSPDLRIGIIAAVGPVFSAGADLRLLATNGPLPYTERGAFAGLVRRDRTKPLIAAVDGPAIAGGCEIALACDIVVASTAASFAVAEVRRGLLAGGGGLVHLARALPRSAAMMLALTGDPISAERAYQLGLVADLVAPGDARSAAVTLAGRIAELPAHAVELSRSLVLRAAAGSLEDAWAANDEATVIMTARGDLGEGARAFLDKQAPKQEITT